MRTARNDRLVFFAVILVVVLFSHSISWAAEPPPTPGLPGKPVPDLPKVTVPPMPDLSIGFFNIYGSWTDFYIDSPGMGPNAIRVRGQVLNRGRKEVRGFEVDVVLSKDMRVSPDDIRLERIVVREVLPPGDASRAGSVLVQSRDNSIVRIPPGEYYVCVRLDPRNTIAESVENNNEYCIGLVRIHKAGSTH
jgi:hypothetical protein